jgi:hypothetical protein
VEKHARLELSKKRARVEVIRKDSIRACDILGAVPKLNLRNILTILSLNYILKLQVHSNG